MSVWIRNNKKHWTKGVPFAFGAKSYSDKFSQNNLLGLIEEFNRTVGKQVFFKRSDEQDYVEFEYGGADSPLGIQGGKQILRYDEKCLFHEMGHCLGMGHQHYYFEWPIKKFLQSIDLEDFNAKINSFQYATDRKYDNTSVMCYRLDAFARSPSIVAALANETVAKGGDEQDTKSRRSSLGGKPKQVKTIPTTKEDVKAIRLHIRDVNSNDMKLGAGDVELIKTLCPEAEDVE